MLIDLLLDEAERQVDLYIQIEPEFTVEDSRKDASSAWGRIRDVTDYEAAVEIRDPLMRIADALERIADMLAARDNEERNRREAAQLLADRSADAAVHTKHLERGA